jgi:hypothetical protein
MKRKCDGRAGNVMKECGAQEIAENDDIKEM